MYNITSKQDLDTAIMLLENEVEEQKGLLTDQFRLIYESFRPSAIIKDVLTGVTTSDELKGNILTATFGISIGYLLKKLFFKKSKNPLKSLFGNLFHFVVAKLIINPGSFLNTIIDPIREFFDIREEETTIKEETPGQNI
jgi:hypothetical protein